jgi:hypothetical protein
MKILTATAQGADRDDDFCYAIEGEIVMASVVCDSPNCGCDRALGGLNSHRATTTVMVRDLDLTMGDLETATVGYLESAGWATMIAEHSGPEDGPDPVRAVAHELMQDTLEVAAEFGEGVILRMAYDRQDDSWVFAPA